jgi:hypothetical protein
MELTEEQKKALDEAGQILAQAGFTHIDLSGPGLSGFGGGPRSLRPLVEILCTLNRPKADK